jgi:hypothetical protein
VLLQRRYTRILRQIPVDMVESEFNHISLCKTSYRGLNMDRTKQKVQSNHIISLTSRHYHVISLLDLVVAVLM